MGLIKKLFIFSICLLIFACKVDNIRKYNTNAGSNNSDGNNNSNTSPTITSQPKNQDVILGQKATFSVTASGASTLTYQWKKNGTNINRATSLSYTTPVTLLSDNGSSFTVTITNSAGSVNSNIAILTVGYVDMSSLPPDRRTIWNPGLNSVGGIPSYTSIFTTLSSSGGSDTVLIQNALNAAGAAASNINPKVVYLNAGTYKITGEGVNIPSYVVLRGAGPSQTKLVRDFKGTGVDVKIKIVQGGLGGSQDNTNVATFVYSTNAGSTYTTTPELITFSTAWDMFSSPLLRITFAVGDGTNGYGGITYTAGDIFTIHWNAAIAPFGDWEITHTGTGFSGLEIDNSGDDYGIITIGSSGWADLGTAINLTSNAIKGASSVTVSDTTGLLAGDLIHIDELNEIAVGRVWLAEETNEWFSRLNRNVSQRMEIDHISGKTIYFTTVFHTSFRTSQSAQISKVNNPVLYAGVEDIYAYGGRGGDGGGNFLITNGKYCWIKHVESERSAGAGAGVAGSFRSVIRDSYIHTAAKIYPGSAEYMLCVDSGSSDNLVENNIAWNAGKATVMRASGGGNVIAYNYMDDIFISDPAFVNFIESGANSSHQTTPHFELFEGNQSFNFDSDTTHGNAFNIVALRNHLTGLRRSSARPLPSYGAVTSVDNHNGYGPRIIDMSDTAPRACVRPSAHDYNFSFIGNILGYSGMPLSINGTETQQTIAMYDMEGNNVQDDVLGMWMLGAATGGDWQAPVDMDVINSVLRDANFDYTSNQQRWHGIGRGTTPYSAPPSYTLPKSFYLSVKPAFFGLNPWPWVTPESTTKINVLPARVRFDAGTPNVVQ